jgi:cysteine desulfurase family protein (TIGR01976 family)
VPAGIDIEALRAALRSRFPALQGGDVLLDNAGGTQVPAAVADRVRDYMLRSFVQVGADYAVAKAATATVARARSVLRTLMGAGAAGEVALGPSTSALCAMLADCYRRAPRSSRNEIVVSEAGHEANVGPWLRLAREGFVPRLWRLDRAAQECPLAELERLVSERTLLVALPHVSNLLGRVERLAEATAIAHRAGARVVVDGVAFAPHRPMDVAAWGVDWYVFSVYKVFGPHMAALYGSRAALADVEGPNHFFVDRADVPYKLELGGVLHEGCAGALGLGDYLPAVAGVGPEEPLRRETVAAAFARIEDLEAPLGERLLGWLGARGDVRLIGPAAAGAARVPTVCFVHARRSSKEIALAANAAGLGVRYGHFYAHRLAAALGLDPEDGVVRASLVHYNSPEEVERLIAFLAGFL